MIFLNFEPLNEKKHTSLRGAEQRKCDRFWASRNRFFGKTFESNMISVWTFSALMRMIFFLIIPTFLVFMHRSYLGGYSYEYPPTHNLEFFHSYKWDVHETLWQCCLDPLTLFQSLGTAHQLKNWLLHTHENNKCPQILRFLAIIWSRKNYLCG